LEWLHHPKFVPVRDGVIACLKQKEYQFRKLGKVLFLCGGFGSPRRDWLAGYLRRYDKESLVFYAEAVWAVIAQHTPDANALAVEKQLAELADAVIVIVESPGTFAELGAFTISEPLRKKLLPILDEGHIGQESFIRSGPITWVDRESQFAPSIWASLDRILEVIPQIEERLSRITLPKPAQCPNLLASPKHLVFFLCDIISIFGPCPADYVRFFTNRVLGNGGSIDVPLLLGLGKAMGLLKSFFVDTREMFFRPLTDGHLIPFQHTKRFIDIPTLRARIVGTMLSCSPARRVLEHMGTKHGAR
jgi:hypothetical protein